MSDQGNGQRPQQPDPDNGPAPDGQQQPGQSGAQRLPGNAGGRPLPGRPGGQRLPGHTGGQPQQGNQDGQPRQNNNGGRQQGAPGGQWTGPQQGRQEPGWNTGGQQAPGYDGGQWSGPQQQWSGGQPPWTTGGQDTQPPWSTGQTGPNVGPTMNNPQNSYYDRFSAASGEGVQVPTKQDGNGGGRGKVLIGLAAALVLVVAAVAIFAFTRGDDSPTQAGGSSSASALPPVKATTWVNPTIASGARALKDGWQAQQANDPRGVFDVPKTKDWKLDSSDTYFGYSDAKTGKAAVITKAPALYGTGYCKADKDDESAWLGLVNVGKRDPSDAGPDIAQKFADAIAGKKDGSKAKEGKLSDPKSIKVNQGTIPALQYTITTAIGDPGDCDKGKDVEIRTVTFSSGGKSYQLVSVRSVGVSKVLSPKKLDEIFTTFRPSN